MDLRCLTLPQRRRRAMLALKRRGIKTTADVDAWIQSARKRGASYSRYSAVVELCGDEIAAMWIFHDLAVATW